MWNPLKNGRFSTSKHLLYMKPIEKCEILYIKAPVIHETHWKMRDSLLYIKPPVIHETHWKMGDSLHQSTCYTWNPLKNGRFSISNHLLYMKPIEKWEILYIKAPVIHETHWKMGGSLYQTTCYTWNPLKNGRFSISNRLFYMKPIETLWKMGDSPVLNTAFVLSHLRHTQDFGFTKNLRSQNGGQIIYPEPKMTLVLIGISAFFWRVQPPKQRTNRFQVYVTKIGKFLF